MHREIYTEAKVTDEMKSDTKNYLKIIALILLAVMAIFIFRISFAAEICHRGDSIEYDVKAAYIINIIKFVEWEKIKNNGEIIKIGIIGSDPICDVIEKLENDKAGGRTIVIQRIDLEQAVSSESHIILIGCSESKRVSSILKIIKGTGILSVSDIPDFARNGGIAGFKLENDRVKIEINIAEAKNSGLKFGAKLLEVARIIR